MKLTRVSDHIWRLQAWLVFPITVWLVVDEDGATLVDAGLPMMARGIRKAVDAINAGPLQRIVLTHGHSDHVGAISRLWREMPDVPVYAHRLEIPYTEGELPYPGRKKAVTFLAKGLAQPLAEETDGRLARIGQLQPYLTPGHAPGHVVYYHEQDRVILAGDLFNAKRGQLRFPIFTFDKAKALQSSRIVQELAPTHLEACHGGPVARPVEQMGAYWQANVRFAAEIDGIGLSKSQ